MKKQTITILSLVILATVWIYFNKAAGEDADSFLKMAVPQAAAFDIVNETPLTFKATDTAGKGIGYVAFGEAIGYGGPLKMAVVINPSGEISRTLVVKNVETPVYLGRIIHTGYLEQFKGKAVGASFQLGEDMDGISGATISSRAISDAVRKASHSVGRQQLNLQIAEKQALWRVGIREIIVILLFAAAALAALVWRNSKIRFPLICASISILGFWLNRPISLAYISGGLLGYFPSFHQNILWYIILFGGLGLAFFSGRNIYCYWLCPFGGIQEVANRISGVRCSGKNTTENKMRLTRSLLLWIVLLLVFVYRNPAVGVFEPFGTLFGFKGVPAAWLQLAVVLVAAMFSFRFWCKYFCPVGAALDICAKVGRNLRNCFVKLKGAPALPSKQRSKSYD